MSRNVGSIDRTIRTLIGLALLSALILVEGEARWLGLLGLVPLLSGVFARCPAYSVMGLRTCPYAKVAR